MTMDKMSIKTNTRITIEKSWKENEKQTITPVKPYANAYVVEAIVTPYICSHQVIVVERIAHRLTSIVSPM